MRKVVLLAMMALAASACLGSDFGDSVTGNWQLSSGTVDGDPIPLVDTHPITIDFEEDERVSGTASCNGYGGVFVLDGASISFEELFMTEMACEPPEAMTAERMYGEALTRVDTVSIDGGMTLTGEGVELIFAAENTS